ncbi:uncharacterized protein WCC33_012625 [Rhinophrynus dorsalis]
MLMMFQRDFDLWLEQGKSLKIWLAETMDLQERLHGTACDSEPVIRKQLELQEVIFKSSGLMKEKMDEFYKMSSKLKSILKEISNWSEKFHEAMRAKACHNGTKRWNDILIDSVTEEAAQVEEHFSATIKLSECYCAHLKYLLKVTNQEHLTPQCQRKCRNPTPAPVGLS